MKIRVRLTGSVLATSDLNHNEKVWHTHTHTLDSDWTEHIWSDALSLKKSHTHTLLFAHV